MTTPNARALQLPPIDGTARIKLTPMLQAQVVGALKVTGSIKTACVALGIPWKTACRWFAKGRAGEEPYASFNLVCQQAKQQREIVLEGIVLNAAFGDPKRGIAGDWRAANALRKVDKRSARQRAADAGGGPSGGDEGGAILIYPVAVGDGADLAAVAAAHGAAIDTHGEAVPQGGEDGQHAADDERDGLEPPDDDEPE